jgi:hypothetical protein
MLRITIALAAIVTLAACATADGPQFQPELKKPEAGRARLYVYRPDTIIGMANAYPSIIHLDGRRLAPMRIGGSIMVPVLPGQHKLTTTYARIDGDTGRVLGETTFAAVPGATVYLRYTEGFKNVTATVLPKGGAYFEGAGDYRFEQVPEPEALAELAKTKALQLDSKLQ